MLDLAGSCRHEITSRGVILQSTVSRRRSGQRDAPGSGAAMAVDSGGTVIGSASRGLVEYDCC